MSESISVVAVDPSLVEQAKNIAERWELPYGEACFQLQLIDQSLSPTGGRLQGSSRLAASGISGPGVGDRGSNTTILQLVNTEEPQTGAVFVDFVGGAVGHRRRFGGGRGQPIAKAVGLKGGANPDVVDATGGLGRDAFVLASLGCHVTLLERSSVVAALLDDGLKRARKDAEIGPWVNERLCLIHTDAIKWMNSLAETNFPDVVYLDPMFPHRNKSALVKKEMRLLQQLLGGDADANGLLPAAIRIAKKRVVVKRPVAAPHLAEMKPSMSVHSKKHRFDVYVKAAM